MQSKHPNYYEGILQLRNPSKEVIEWIREVVEKDKNVAIAKETRVTNGVDFYLTSNRFLLKVGKALQNRFGGEVKRSSKLHSVDKTTSKKMYRGTVLFRMPPFGKGDTIEYKGEQMIVVSMGKRALLKNSSTGKKISVRFDQL